MHGISYVRIDTVTNCISSQNHKNMKTTAKLSLTLVIGVTALLANSAFADVDVTPSNMHGWSFLTTDNNGDPQPGNGNTAQMVTGPGTPPLGVGSAQLATASGQGDTSSQILTSQYNGTSVSSLTSLGYSTYDTVNNGQQFPYLKLSINTTGVGGAGNIDDALFFEPPYQTPGTGNPSLPDQGPTVMSQWQSWNAFTGGWWNNNGDFNPGTTEGSMLGVDSISAYLALYPNATIEGVSLRVGYASPTDNFNGYVDGFTIGISGTSTTSDFEPDPVSAVPEPSTIIAGASMLLPFGASALRMLRKRQTA